MADTNITSLPPVEETITGVDYAVVKILGTGANQNYSGEPQIWGNAQVIQITLRNGADPGEAVLEVPVGDVQNVNDRISDSKVCQADQGNAYISRIRAPDYGPQNFMYSQVSIYSTTEPNDLEANLGIPLFVGYIVDYEWIGSRDSTAMRVRCEDARHFWKKAPVQGTIFYNPQANQVVYIRAHDPIFNDGNLPNRYVKKEGSDNDEMPMFVNANLNRFYNKPGETYDRHLVADDQVSAQLAAGTLGNVAAGQPYAGKWFLGHAWNYLRFLHFKIYTKSGDSVTINPLINRPDSTVIGRSLSVDDFPVNLSETMDLQQLTYGGGTAEGSQWEAFFTPRALIGTPQSGGVEFASGLGTFAPAGIPVGDVALDLCQRAGNYTLACRFGEDRKLYVFPVKTANAIGEIAAGGPQAPGAQGGLGVAGAGKLQEIVLPSPSVAHKDTPPEVSHWNVKQTGRNYYNRAFVKGGRRWVMITASTLGTQDWQDPLASTHKAYSPPAGEWKPTFTGGSLVPGWTTDDQDNWLKLWGQANDRVGDKEAYEDVFRTWILKDDLSLVGLWNIGTTAQGYRMYLERDRQILQRLVPMVFQRTAGSFRSRAYSFPMQLWRAYQGIALNDADNKTAYGSYSVNPSESWRWAGAPVEGKKRWFRCQASFEPINDGRIGFRLSSDARRRIDFPFEDTDCAGSGYTMSPWSWNGNWNANTSAGHPHPYEMFWTLTMEADEDMYDYLCANQSDRSYQHFGPAMEIHRDAGSEYGEEAISSSVWDNPFASYANFKYRQVIPDPAEPGVEGTRAFYRTAKPELAARASLILSRYAMPDMSGELIYDHLALDLVCGTYINQLTVPGDQNVQIGAMITQIIHNFVTQKTSVTLETVR